VIFGVEIAHDALAKIVAEAIRAKIDAKIGS
jgi:hypothetical protein